MKFLSQAERSMQMERFLALKQRKLDGERICEQIQLASTVRVRVGGYAAQKGFAVC